MEFSERDFQFSIRINTIFTLTTPKGCTLFNPEKTQECGPTLELLNAVVISAKAFKTGRLEITFSESRVLSVDPNPQFEAWEAVGGNGPNFVALPGHKLAIWDSNLSAIPSRST